MRAPRWLETLLALAPAALVSGAIALSPTPPECGPGAAVRGCWEYALGQRLLYVHVPLAWVAYAGFLVATIAAVRVLLTDSRSAARWMRSAIEVTTVFAASALAAGLAWSYEFPIYDPLADAKVQATIVLVAALAGLWLLSASAKPSRRDRLLASLTPVAFLSVPASYYASRLVSPHPDFLSGTDISTRMTLLLVLATVGFTALWGLVAWTRQILIRFEEAHQW